MITNRILSFLLTTIFILITFCGCIVKDEYHSDVYTATSITICSESVSSSDIATSYSEVNSETKNEDDFATKEVYSCSNETIPTVVTKDDDKSASATLPKEDISLSERQIVSPPHETENETRSSMIFDKNDTDFTKFSETSINECIEVPYLKVENIDYNSNYLSWNDVENAVGYKIYIKSVNDFEEYGYVNVNHCKDVKLDSATEYTYMVRAKFADGTLGEKSNEATIRTYSRIASPLQGKYYYYVDSDKVTGSFLIKRYDIYLGKTENVYSTKEKIIGDIKASHDKLYYLYYRNVGKFEYQGISSLSLDNNYEENLVERVTTDDSGATFDIMSWEVYCDNLYYTTFESGHEEGDVYTYLNCYNKKDLDLSEFHNLHENVWFLSNSNDELDIIWTEQEMYDIEDNDLDSIFFRNTGNIIVLNVESGEKTIFNLTDNIDYICNIVGVDENTIYSECLQYNKQNKQKKYVLSTSSNGSCRKIDTEEDLLDVIISTKYSFIIYNSYKSNPNDDSLNILCKDLESSDEKIIDEIKASNLVGIIVYGDYLKYWDSENIVLYNIITGNKTVILLS